MDRVVRLKVKLILVSLIATLLSIWSLKFVWCVENSGVRRVVAGFFGCITFSLALISLWMTFKHISYGHTLLTVYLHLLLGTILDFSTKLKMKRILISWKNPREAQEEYLQKILKANIKSLYTKENGLGSVSSLKELREKHALTEYEHYRPYVERMTKGEQGVLTSERVVRFTLTSGTTGKPKIIPYTNAYLSEAHATFMSVMRYAVVRSFGAEIGLKKEFYFYTAPKLRHSEDGTLMGPASMIPSWIMPFLVMYSTPSAAYGITDPSDSVYVHLLFGLRDRNLRAVSAGFTPHLMSAMRQLEECWPDIVRDIEQGTISTTNVSAEIHRSLLRALRGGDPKRAAELRKEFERGFEGILKRMWPHLERVQAIDSTGVKDVLRDSYVKGLPLYGHCMLGTEGFYGYNLWPKAKGGDEFVLTPSSNVFEFIPEEYMHENQPDTLFIDELQIGGVYELVVTQIFGIYRFRIGDVIRVKRYHFKTPVIEFMYRSGQILNVFSEKLHQRTIHAALVAAVGHWPDAKLVEYAVAESNLLEQLTAEKGQEHPFYLIFLELGATNEDIVSSSQLVKVDEELCQHSFTYNSYREKGSIAPPVVHVVESGTFDRLHDFILDHSTTTANQYKVPRKLRTTETLKLMLDSSILSSELNCYQ